MPLFDTHAHVFTRDLPFVIPRRYTPDYDAPFETYLQQLDRNSMSHGVLVQPSFLGTDNSYIAKALARYPDRLRGVAVVDPEISEDQLQALAGNHFVGIRLNLTGLPIPDLGAAPWVSVLRAIVRLQWQVEVNRDARDLPLIVGPLLAAGVHVVVDHFGRPDATLGIDDPGFRYLLSTASSGRVWVKIAAAYRLAPGRDGEVLAQRAFESLRDAFGLKRLIWGSDWPHTQCERSMSYPAARAQLDAIIRDPAERQEVLSGAAATLFHF